MTGLIFKPVFFDKTYFLFYNSGMKRFVIALTLLFVMNPVFAAGENKVYPEGCAPKEDLYIVPAPPEETNSRPECETFIQTRGVGQVCIPEDNSGDETKEPEDSNNDALQKSMNDIQRLADAALPEKETAAASQKQNSAVQQKVSAPQSQSAAKSEKTAPNPRDLYAQALALYSDNSNEAALETFKQIPEYARTTTAWLLMGNILADMGKKDEAIFMYRRAISVDSDNYKAYYNLGNMYLDDDIFYTAIDCYKDAIKAKMTFPYAYYNLGIAYVKTGNLKKAKSAFLNALEYKKDVADFHYNLAYVYKLMNKPKLAQTYLDNYNKLMGY